MRKSRMGIRRLPVIFALLAMALVTGSSLAVLSGRSPTSCVKSCLAIRNTCDSNCKTECRELFQDNKPQRDACIVDCKAKCAAESDECKLICQQIKHPPSPEVP